MQEWALLGLERPVEGQDGHDKVICADFAEVPCAACEEPDAIEFSVLANVKGS